MSPDDVIEHPPLAVSETEAEALVESVFGIHGNATRLPSERDDNFRITGESGDYSLKIANPAESPAVVEMQQLAIEHLNAADSSLPVPAVIHTIEGDLVATIEVDGQTAMARLLTYLNGETPGVTDSRDLRDQLGRIAADLDRALRTFDHPELRRDYVWNLAQVGRVRRYASALEEARFQFFVRWLDRFTEEIEPRLGTLPHQAIHSDLNPENLLVDAATPMRIVGIIDFGDLVHAPRVAEPAIAAAYQCLGCEDPTGVLTDVVGAYHDVTALSGAEIANAPDLAMARLVQSISIGAWRARHHATNRDYILIHTEPAWEALQRLDRIGVATLRDALHEACR